MMVTLMLTLAAAVSVRDTTPLLHTLMPVPASVTLSHERLAVDQKFTVAVSRYHDARLERAVARAMARLGARAGVIIPPVHIGAAPAALVIDVAASGYRVPDLAEDESYDLTVATTGARLSAHTVVGAIRGLETLLQLQQADSAGIFLQGSDIHDAPRFRWRGLLLDVSRHFEPVAVVERTLDGMAAVKLNVLHWHLSDDQGFRVESHRFAGLQRGGSDSLFYTQAEIREVVRYATDRGIRVMPEFDVPGHASSWFVGYPQLASGPGPFAIARSWGTFAPTMDPTRESTYRFLDGFIGEMTALFPDRYWHIGGDEVDTTQWTQNPSIQRWMKRHHINGAIALHTSFNQRLFRLVQKHARIPVGWDEIFQPGLPTSAVIQSWRSADALAASARAGFRGILSAPYYIDHQRPTSDFYTPDPLPAGNTLTPAEQALVLGGEACMWGEYVTPETIDSRIWPRLAAIAERFWSPVTVTDVTDMYRRLAVTSRRMEELGLRYVDHGRRIVRQAAGDSAPALEALLDYVRPRDFGGSGALQQSPHAGLIDAAVADPVHNWDLTNTARRAATGDTAAQSRVRSALSESTRLRDRLHALASTTLAAREASPVADALADLGATGLQALDYIRRRSPPDAAWRTRADSMISFMTSRRVREWPLRPVTTDAVRILATTADALPPSAPPP